MMEMPGSPDHVEFWQRARRHLLKYGGEFVDFVQVRAEGAFLYDADGRRVLDLVPQLPKIMLLSTGGRGKRGGHQAGEARYRGWEVAGFAQSWHGGAAASATYKAGRRGDGSIGR